MKKIHCDIFFIYFQDSLAEDIRKAKRKNRSANDKATLILTRIMVNCIVLLVLAGALFLVYFTTDKLLEVSRGLMTKYICSLNNPKWAPK